MFTVDTLRVRDVGCTKAISFKESLVARRSATWPPVTNLVVSQGKSDYPDYSRSFVRMACRTGVTVADVMEGFASIGTIQGSTLLSVQLERKALRAGEVVLYGRWC